MPRSLSSDLLRLFLMYLVCLVHAVGYVPSRWAWWLTNVSFVGVVGFVLVSGYYGIRFTWRKALKIEGTGLGCAITVAVLAWLAGALPLRALPGETLSLFRGYWFVHAYVVLMVLADLAAPRLAEVAAAPSRLHAAKLPVATLFKHPAVRPLLPLLFLVFVWSFLQHVPGVQRLVPRTAGLDPYSGLVLFGIYAVGRLYRAFDLDARLKGRWIVPIALGCWAISGVDWGYLARYDSPFLLVAAIGILWGFRRIRLSDAWARPLALLTPSVLSVYLIHCNPHGYRVFASVEPHVLSALAFLPPTLAQYAAFFVLALGAFAAGLALDLPRRAVVAAARRMGRGVGIVRRS